MAKAEAYLNISSLKIFKNPECTIEIEKKVHIANQNWDLIYYTNYKPIYGIYNELTEKAI